MKKTESVSGNKIQEEEATQKSEANNSSDDNNSEEEENLQRTRTSIPGAVDVSENEMDISEEEEEDIPKMTPKQIEEKKEQLIKKARQHLIDKGQIPDMQDNNIAVCCFQHVENCHTYTTRKPLQFCKTEGCTNVFHGDCFDSFFESQEMIDETHHRFSQSKDICLTCFEQKAEEINHVKPSQSSTGSNSSVRKSSRKSLNRKEKLNLVDMLAKDNPKTGDRLMYEYNGYLLKPPAKRKRN